MQNKIIIIGNTYEIITDHYEDNLCVIQLHQQVDSKNTRHVLNIITKSIVNPTINQVRELLRRDEIKNALMDNIKVVRV